MRKRVQRLTIAVLLTLTLGWAPLGASGPHGYGSDHPANAIYLKNCLTKSFHSMWFMQTTGKKNELQAHFCRPVDPYSRPYVYRGLGPGTCPSSSLYIPVRDMIVRESTREADLLLITCRNPVSTGDGGPGICFEGWDFGNQRKHSTLMVELYCPNGMRAAVKAEMERLRDWYAR